MVAQLRDPGLGRARGEPVAEAHDVLLLGQGGPVRPFAAAAATDVPQAQRMAEFMQDRACMNKMLCTAPSIGVSQICRRIARSRWVNSPTLRCALAKGRKFVSRGLMMKYR